MTFKEQNDIEWSSYIGNWFNYINGKISYDVLKKELPPTSLFPDPKLLYVQDLFTRIKSTIDNEFFDIVDLLKEKNVSPYDILNNFENDPVNKEFFGDTDEINKQDLIIHFKKFNVFIKLIEKDIPSSEDNGALMLDTYVQVFPKQKTMTVYETEQNE